MKKMYLILVCGSLFIVSSCKTTAPIVSTPRNDSIVIRHHYERDSIYVLDSVAVAVVHDTVYVNRWKTKDRFSIINKTDTVYQDKEVVIHSPPERYIPLFYRWCTRVLIIAVILLICYIALRVVVKIYLHR
jgi:hypothetical protein